MATPPMGPLMGGGDYRMQGGMLQSSAAAGMSQGAMPVPDMMEPSVTVSATPSGQRLFQCGHCNRSYTRLDHLARHVRSHTLEKPFLCHVCSKRFSRADLLKRHATNHTAEAVSKKRQRRQHTHPGRVTQACRACALAKLKCEEEKPCRRCQTKDLACEYSSLDGVKIRRTLQGTHMRGQLEAEMEDSIHVSSREDSGIQSEMVDGDHHQLQVMTPETTAQESPIHPQERGFEFDESSFADFLKDVMMPISFSPFPGAEPASYQNQGYTPRDVLNFGIDTNLELDDLDFGLLNSYNGKGLLNSDRSDAGSSEGNQSHEGGPDVKKRLSLGIEAFKRSLWRYDPGRQHTGTAEHDNLSIPTNDMDSPGTRVRNDMRVINERIDQSTRDKILAMTLKTCPPDKLSRVVASFPTAELLDNFMHMYFASRIRNVDSWIHPATFKPKNCHPELVGAVAAAGATLTPIHTVRKLGYALQEAVRMSIPMAIEKNNALTRDIQILQAYVMHLDIGAWSGNRRKMEMAESFGGPVTTMLRRNGKFRRSAYTAIVPRAGDEGDTLEAKWRKWVEQESFKRLVFHLFLHDQQLSISFLVNPLMSYAEMCLPVPASRDLWLAMNATEWKTLFLRRQTPAPERWPCLADCNHDMALLMEAEGYIDMHLSHAIILHRIWGLIWEYRQINSVSKGPFREGNGALVLQSRHQELCQSLHRFRMSSTISSHDGLIMLELLHMSLHVSLEDLQLFAGKEGEEEARRVLPLLQQWVQSRDSRQAVWHAGQIIRAAKSFPRGHLRDFFAVALYHASLAFWAYGIVSRVCDRPPPDGGPQSPIALTSNNSHVSPVEALTTEPVWLDGPETIESQRFVALEQGIPGVRGVTSERHALLEDPRAVVYVVLEVFSENVDEPPPPLVENLSQLMRDLGNAAWAVHSGQQSRGDYVY